MTTRSKLLLLNSGEPLIHCIQMLEKHIIKKSEHRYILYTDQSSQTSWPMERLILLLLLYGVLQPFEYSASFDFVCAHAISETCAC